MQASNISIVSLHPSTVDKLIDYVVRSISYLLSLFATSPSPLSSIIITSDDNNANAGDGNNKSNKSATVRFDVGGTVYRVSRSLLDLFPDTMLSRMVSETWQDCSQGGDDQKEEPPIFLDRNGDRFQYVLDYMRDDQNPILP